MIYEVLQVITEEVNSYLGSTVVLENIGMLDGEPTEGGTSSSSTNDIVLTLLNLQEEFTMKNTAHRHVSGTTVTYKNPKVNLNLYILFSANNTTYSESLKSISKIIEFFQGKTVFTQANTTFLREGDMLNIGDFCFQVHLYTPSFEELNFIWGTLGGKQYPSVLYKVALIDLERDDAINGLGRVIENEDNLLTHLE